MEEKKPYHLTVKYEYFKNGKETYQFIWPDYRSEYKIWGKTLTGTIHTVFTRKERTLENMPDARNWEKQNGLISKDRAKVKFLLHTNFKKILKNDYNYDTANRFPEEICHQSPESQPCLQQNKFQPFFFKNVLPKFSAFPYRHRADLSDNCDIFLLALFPVLNEDCILFR